MPSARTTTAAAKALAGIAISQGMTYYGYKAWDRLVIAEAALRIRRSGLQFDSFAARGLSGVVFAAKLAHVMHKNLVAVRYDRSSHSSSMVEGCAPARYMFVDDFVGSGQTRCAVLDEISILYPNAECVGQYLYNDAELRIYRPEYVRSEETADVVSR